MKNKTNHLLFFLYFLSVTAFPYSHCHAAEGLIKKGPCKTEYGIERALPSSRPSCCEFREHKHADHVHFLIEDHAAAKRLRDNISPTPQTVLAAGNASLDVLAGTRTTALSRNAHKPQEGHLFAHSGLSPPRI